MWRLPLSTPLESLLLQRFRRLFGMIRM